MSATDTYSNLVQEFYVAYFGRPADPAAVPSFAAALATANAPTTLADLTSAYGSSDTIRALIDSFGNSHESAALYGAVSNDAAQAASFVSAIFANLFNRAPAAAGLSYWVDALLDGSLSPGNAALTIAAAASANTSAQGVLDAHAVANKTAVATLFTADLSNPSYVAAYAGADAASAARALLAGVGAATVPADYAAAIRQAADTIAQAHPSAPDPVAASLSAGNDTLTATKFTAVLSAVAGASTLNDGDTLHGSGAAVLDINSDGTSFPSGATLDHIHTINIAATGDLGIVDVTGYSDVSALNITVAAGATAQTAYVFADQQNVTVSGDVLSGGNDLSVYSGRDATVSAVGATTDDAANTGDLIVDAVGAIRVTETVTAGADGSIFGNISVAYGSSATVNATINSAAFDSSTAIPTSGQIEVAFVSGAITVNDAVHVTGLTSHTVQADDVLVHDGGSTITVNQTVTTAAGTTGISTVTEGEVAVFGGYATSSVTVNQAAPDDGSIGAAGAAHVVDASVDILDANRDIPTTASNTITTITLGNYSNAVIVDNALSSLTLSGTDGDLLLYNSALGSDQSNTTLHLALNHAQTGMFTDTFNEITTLDVTLGAGASSIASFQDLYLNALNVTGSGVLTLPYLPNTVATLTVSGNAGFTGSLAGTGVTSFAPTGTGAITVELEGSQSFTGGSGADLVALISDLHADSTISAGSSAHNELVLEGIASFFTATTGANTHGFSTLGVSDAGGNGDTYDMGTFTGYTALEVIAAASSVDFANVAAGTTLAVDSSVTNMLSYQLATANTASTALSLTLGTAATSGISIGMLCLFDGTLGGITKLNLASDGSAANTIATLYDTQLSALNLSGTADVTIGQLQMNYLNQPMPAGVATFALNNNSAGVASVGLLYDDTLGHLTVAGSGVSVIDTLEADNAVALTINNTGAHALAIATLQTNGNGAAPITDGLSTLTLAGGSAINVGTLADPGNTAAIVLSNNGTATDSITNWAPGSGLTALTVNGNLVLGAAATSATAPGTPVSLTSDAGVTVAAGSDNARLNLALSGAGAGNTDTVTLGNGDNHLVDASSAGTVHISVGSGANVIDLGNTASVGYVARVTLAAHGAAGGDSVIVGTLAAGALQPSVVISGAAGGDHIIFVDAAISAVALSASDQNAVSQAHSLAAAIANVDVLASTVAHSVTLFHWDDNSYLLESAAAGNGTLTANDGLIELVGNHGIGAVSNGLVSVGA